MSNSPHTNEGLGDLFSGDSVSGSTELHGLLSDLRHEFGRGSDVPVQGALREFLDVADLPTTINAASAASRRPKMITTIGAFVATTTGKIVLGTAVAAASVGGAHAADIVDVPGMERAPVVVEIEGELPVADEAPDTLVGDDVLPEELNVQDEQGGEDAVDVVEGDEVESEDADDAMNSDDGDTSDEDTGDKPDNHGQVVSDFVHSTDLEGCEKGQAVAALASSKVNENQDGDKESPKKSAEDRADKCNNDEQDADDEDGEELDVDADGEDGEDGEDEAAEEAEKPAKADQQAGKADGKATGKPEWAESKGKKSDRS